MSPFLCMVVWCKSYVFPAVIFIISGMTNLLLCWIMSAYDHTTDSRLCWCLYAALLFICKLTQSMGKTGKILSQSSFWGWCPEEFSEISLPLLKTLESLPHKTLRGALREVPRKTMHLPPWKAQTVGMRRSASMIWRLLLSSIIVPS